MLSEAPATSKLAIASPAQTTWPQQEEILSELRGAQTRINYLESENISLRNKLSVQTHDHLSVSTYLQEEVEHKTTALQELKEKHDRHTVELAQIEERVSGEWKNLLDDAIAERDRLVLRNKDIQQELDDTETFRKERQGMVERIRDLEKAVENAKEEHIAEVREMDHLHLQEKVKMKDSFDKKLTEAYTKAETDIRANLGPAQRMVRRQNDGLNDKLSALSTQTQKLHDEATASTNKAIQFKIDLEIQKELVDSTARRSTQQQMMLRHAQQKVEALNDALTEQAAAHQAQLDRIAAEHDVEVEALKTDVYGLKKLVQLKSVDLAKVRGIASRILQQRTDLEYFLSETLEEVRARLAEERGADFMPGRPRLGPIAVTTGQEVKGMVWMEREAALIKMMARINQSTK